MWTLGTMLIAVVIIVAACALAYVGCQAMGVQIPAWVKQVGWIVLIAVVVVLAIRFVVSLW